MEFDFKLCFVACFLLLGVGGVSAVPDDDDTNFDDNYFISWGDDRVHSLDLGRQIQLSLDTLSGSGFASKQNYSSGFFHLRIKLPGRNSAGTVTAFYLTSHAENHDEVDFEFLGNVEGKPITLQTNVFVDGVGSREQRIGLWFDPTADFHTYSLLWNRHQIVFYVDAIPVRVYKNLKSSRGVGYPTKEMRVEASIWDASSWATDGGNTKIDWSYAPFLASFRGFDISACSSSSSSLDDDDACDSAEYWWNLEGYLQLSPDEQREYENVRQDYITYDYCTDSVNNPVPPPECVANS